MVNTAQITVSVEVAAAIHQLVGTGHVASDADVVSAALQILHRQKAMKAMQAKVTASLADPRPSMTSEEVNASLDQLMEERLRSRHA